MNLATNPDGSVTVNEEDGSQATALPVGSGTYAFPSWADSSISQHPDGTWAFVRRGRQLFAFSATGKVTAIGDLNGNAITLSYNPQGQPVTVTDGAGRHLTLTFGTNGLVSSVSDPAGRLTGYLYDGSGNLLSVSDVGAGPTVSCHPCPTPLAD